MNAKNKSEVGLRPLSEHLKRRGIKHAENEKDAK